jgi:hypothetical protein
VYGTSGSNEQVVFFPERTQRSSNFEMEMRVEASIHRYNRCGRAAVREHPNQNEIRIVNPVEGLVSFAVEAGGLEHGYTAVGGGDVGVEFVVYVFGGMDVGYWGFGWIWVGGYLDFVIETVPVGSLF